VNGSERCRFRAAVLALLLAVLALPGAAARAAAPTAEQAVADLNAWRAAAGETPVTAIDRTLSEGCRLHNAYVKSHPGAGHRESPTARDYTELGAQAGESSVLVDAEILPRAGFEEAVFHRMGLLQPRLSTTWWDASSGSACMGITGTSDLLGTPQLVLYPWPARGATRVATTFTADEKPSPYDVVPGTARLGTLISVNVNGPWAGPSTARVATASLIAAGVGGGTGPSVPVAAVDAASVHGDLLSGGFAVFPLRPLAHHTTYVVHVAGTVVAVSPTTFGPQAYPFDQFWSFTTRWPTPRTGFVYFSDGRIRVRSQSRAIALLTIRHAGAVVGQVAVRPGPGGRRVSLLRPGRTYDVCLTQAPRGRWEAFRKCYTLRA
jgi:hypothetical protein